ncbi:hypothetical protein [Cellulomonas sp. PSBB021]|uniref:hypothetical protein n=1 Tax=Cellulomonas sp. PSBB021 TaxID=2003551 RepID=UPI000B8DAC2D|nr:hypothetical protein [Cellulomonas sp. PSBB021]ASR56296.1 hypothetical protein CBP52_15645 [Cellulomonas sp. PSBB021]
MTDIDWETHESRVQHVRRELLAIGRLIEDLPPGEDRTARQVAWDENLMPLRDYASAVRARDAEALALVALVHGPEVVGTRSDL